MAALAEVAIEATVGIVAVDYRTTSLAFDQMLVRAIGAGVVTRILAERRFGFRQGLAAIFTCYSFHRALFMIYD